MLKPPAALPDSSLSPHVGTLSDPEPFNSWALPSEHKKPTIVTAFSSYSRPEPLSAPFPLPSRRDVTFYPLIDFHDAVLWHMPTLCAACTHWDSALAPWPSNQHGAPAVAAQMSTFYLQLNPKASSKSAPLPASPPYPLPRRAHEDRGKSSQQDVCASPAWSTFSLLLCDEQQLSMKRVAAPVAETRARQRIPYVR